MNKDSKTSQESSIQKSPKWIAQLTAGTLSLIALALLQRYGDTVFDTLQLALGKRLVVQAIALLVVLLGYFGWSLIRKPRIRKLVRNRELFWAHRDSTPFCPYCYEFCEKQIHLVGPKSVNNGGQIQERWECYVCYHDFDASSGKSFLMEKSTWRIKPK
jgi:hypothetical protein